MTPKVAAVGGEQVIDAILGGKSASASITTSSDGGNVVVRHGDDCEAILTYTAFVFTRVYAALLHQRFSCRGQGATCHSAEHPVLTSDNAIAIQ